MNLPNSIIPAHLPVIPANAGVQFVEHLLDSRLCTSFGRLRGNDGYDDVPISNKRPR